MNPSKNCSLLKVYTFKRADKRALFFLKCIYLYTAFIIFTITQGSKRNPYVFTDVPKAVDILHTAGSRGEI